MKNESFQIGKSRVVTILSISLVALLIFLGWSIYIVMDRVVITQLAANDAEKARIVNLQLRSDSGGVSVNNSEATFYSQDKIYLCGNLDAKDTLLLSVYWLKLPENDVVYQNAYNERFATGYFCSELKQVLSPGRYKVDIYYQRIILGTIEFTIIE